MGINELKLTIPERAILLSTNPGNIVFDPFGGGGTTYEAAQRGDRLWLGSEISTAEAIANRLEERFPESFGQPTRLPLSWLFGLDNTNRTLRLLESK